MAAAGFGSSSLAHRLWNLGPGITYHQTIDECDSNSRDANATKRMYMFRHSEDEKGPFIERLDYDNGEGMDDPRKLIDPTSKIKTGGQIGRYFSGSYDSIMSSSPDKYWALSRVKYGELGMSTWSPKGMREFAVDKLQKDREAISEVNIQLADKYAPDNLLRNNHEVESKSLKKSNLEIFTHYTWNETIKDFMNNKNHSGLITIQRWYITNEKYEDYCNIPKLVNTLNRIILSSKNPFTYQIFDEKQPVEINTSDVTYLGSNEIFEIKGTYLYGGRNRTDYMVIEYNGLYFKTVMSVKRKFEGITRLGYDELINNAKEKYNIIVKILLDSSRHTEELSKITSDNEESSNTRIFAQPIIETEHKYLGTSDSIMLPTHYKSRSYFGFQEAIRPMFSIYIPEESDNKLSHKFGVNSQKDRIDLTQMSREAETVFKCVIMKIFSSIKKIYGDNNTPFPAMKTYVSEFGIVKECDYKDEVRDTLYHNVFNTVIMETLKGSSPSKIQTYINKTFNSGENRKYLVGEETDIEAELIAYSQQKHTLSAEQEKQLKDDIAKLEEFEQQYDTEEEYEKESSQIPEEFRGCAAPELAMIEALANPAYFESESDVTDDDESDSQHSPVGISFEVSAYTQQKLKKRDMIDILEFKGDNGTKFSKFSDEVQIITLIKMLHETDRHGIEVSLTLTNVMIRHLSYQTLRDELIEYHKDRCDDDFIRGGHILLKQLQTIKDPEQEI